MGERPGNFESENRPEHKCGVTGVWADDDLAPWIARRSLAALQGRGKEHAGLSIFATSGRLQTYTGNGLIADVLTDTILDQLGPAKTAIAHNHYATTGGSKYNAQPFTIVDGEFGLSGGHNGNLNDLNWFYDNGVMLPPMGSSDSAYLMAFLFFQRSLHKSWLETFQKELPKIQDAGSANLVMLTDEGALYGLRDARQLHPMCIGMSNSGPRRIVIASESPALDMTGVAFSRDLKGGELVRISPDGQIDSYFIGPPKLKKPCLFQYVYFDRPDSWVDGQRVRSGRVRSGGLLGERIREKGIKANVVIPTLESGGPASKGVAIELGLPLEEGITTDHYVGRTFIIPDEPDQAHRIDALNGKHNVTPDKIQGLSVIRGDDSNVRSNTGRQMNKKLRRDGRVGEVHEAYASSPVVATCNMGIDMARTEELPAAQWRNEPLAVIERHMAEVIGADSVTYLPLEATAEAFGGVPSDFCHHCFGGPHPQDGQTLFRAKEKIIQGKPKVEICISGSGTNLQQIIGQVEAGTLDADLVGVISNNPDAFGLQRATQHNIPTSVFPSRGKLKDPAVRAVYEAELLEKVKRDNPDVLVLAGFSFVLSDQFLEQMQEMETTVVNLHPALLTRDQKDTMTTSRGEIPVLRGLHMIEEAYNKGTYEMPVSGVTVHQVLPSKGQFDVGPIILQEEVQRIEGETLEQWEARMHEAEYRVLPAALKRVLHVIGHHVDVSKGDFSW